MELGLPDAHSQIQTLSSTGVSLLLSFLHLDDLFVSCILHWLLSYDVNLLADSEQEEQV